MKHTDDLRMASKLGSILRCPDNYVRRVFVPGREEETLLLLLDLGVTNLGALAVRLPDVFVTSKLVNVFLRLDCAKRSAGEVMLKGGYLTKEKLTVVTGWVDGCQELFVVARPSTRFLALTFSYW